MKKTAKEPLADIPEEKEEDVGPAGGAFSDDEDLFGPLD